MLLPPEKKMKPNEEIGVTRVCAWCQRIICDDDRPGEPAPLDNAMRKDCSHGICKTCIDNKVYL